MTQNGTVKKLASKQNKAIDSLLQSKTVGAAAESVGVSRGTLYRWLRRPDFQEVLRQKEGQVLDRAARRLILLANKAIDALESVMDDPVQKGSSQRRYAATAILDNVLKIWELRNVEQRITDLEARINVS